MKLLKEFIIPIDDILEAPTQTVRHTPHYEVLIALGKVATASFTFDEDGLEWLKLNGYIK